ncbi:unnamed protein product [Lymnaea stagnalis]|uniref:Fork-head domain-containing protein n=1 Tax=Lymnaea stagnalis TaxID=6523 RepID=A0AAV2ID50_LYMST
MSPAATLARRFHQNWLAKHPQDSAGANVSLDDSLTSLGWLQNLKVSEITQPRQTAVSGYGLEINRQLIKQELPSPPVLTVQQQRCEPHFQIGDTAPSGGQTDVDYKLNPFMKPPYSYASLICMAMKATRKNKITLSAIYKWITDNFIYYRHSDPSWQNSIRHNLSLNKCFEKVPRRKDEPGKGGFWRINPEYGDLVENGVFKKRRGSRENMVSPPIKRCKQEDDDFPYVAGMKSGAREDKLLSNGSAHFGMDDDENSLTLRGDFNWTSILNQHIDIDGCTVKTEQILDDAEQSPFIEMSPPSSETNSDDLGIDDLFSSSGNFSISIPADFPSNDPLDLTVQGTTIKPPDWWSPEGSMGHSGSGRGLQTPRAPSPEFDNSEPLWGDSLGLNSSGNQFDFEKIFEFDSLPPNHQL